jgi:hypothetical protein
MEQWSMQHRSTKRRTHLRGAGPVLRRCCDESQAVGSGRLRADRVRGLGWFLIRADQDSTALSGRSRRQSTFAAVMARPVTSRSSRAIDARSVGRLCRRFGPARSRPSDQWRAATQALRCLELGRGEGSRGHRCADGSRCAHRRPDTDHDRARCLLRNHSPATPKMRWVELLSVIHAQQRS